MEYRSIMVFVDPDAGEPDALAYAIDLAASFDAQLTGVAAVEPVTIFGAMDNGAAAVDVYAVMHEDAERRLEGAAQRFRAAVPAGMKSAWHSAVANPTRFAVSLAAEADLIVAASRPTAPLDIARTLSVGELILSAGRPVITVGRHGQASAPKVLIAWKDGREARRAVSDALPLLRRAGEILAVTVAEGDPQAERASLDSLIAWLAMHGLKAESRIIGNPEGFEDVLESTALSEQASLVVAGGYGHSRMREWLFGGMTRSLLSAGSVNRFFSN